MSIKLRFSLMASLLILAVSPIRSGAAPGADYVSFRGPNRDGSFAGALPHRRPKALWTFPTAGPVHGSPIWVDGLVLAGSQDGIFYAVDGSSGKERWRLKTGGSIDGPAAYAGGNVIFESRDGNLYAADSRTGRQRWKTPVGADLPFHWGWDFFLSGPAAAGGRVFVGSGSGDVLAVDAADGSVSWRFKTEGRVRSSPTVADGVVYVGSFDGHLYALDAGTGALRWKFATQGVSIDLEKAGFDRRSIQSSPAVTVDLVVVGCRDGHLYGVDRATGKERWNFDHQVSWVVGSPAIAGDRAIVGSSDGHFVQAVELATGKELWRSRTDSNALSSPARAGDVAIVGDATGALLAYDVATGTELWRFRTGESIHSSPLVRAGRIYVGSDDGKIYALGGDLGAPPAHLAIRAVYFDPRAPYRPFEGDEALRDALAGESFRWLTRADLAEFLTARIADRAPSVVVFATAAVPTALVEQKGSEPALVRRYLDAGGKIVWLAEVPFLFTFDPATNQMVPPKREDLTRSTALFGVTANNLGEGECRAQVNELGRRWGISAGWWLGQAPLASDQPGVEALAKDEHGHIAAWARRFGGPEGTGFVFYWGRERPIPDPRIVQALAEYGLP
jgi:outer membrane protein assembly factor BamB